MKNNMQKENVPFYYSTLWLVLFTLFIWPLGLLMLWNYYDHVHEKGLPRTKLVNKELKDFL